MDDASCLVLRKEEEQRFARSMYQGRLEYAESKRIVPILWILMESVFPVWSRMLVARWDLAEASEDPA